MEIEIGLCGDVNRATDDTCRLVVCSRGVHASDS